ncbi:TPA: hypothetical protein DCX15_00135 [bacterium]|nr:hypothetical protein [bacterium]
MTERPLYSKILQDPILTTNFIKEKIESKVRWYQENRSRYEGKTWRSWQKKVLEIFYKENLSLEIPRYGEIVYEADCILVIEWRSPCPILESCMKDGVETLQVCSTLYHLQYQVLLSLIDPRLIFGRDYSHLRPYADSCREIILLNPSTPNP